jgi:hypothetical protein
LGRKNDQLVRGAGKLEMPNTPRGSQHAVKATETNRGELPAGIFSSCKLNESSFGTKTDD